MQSVIPITPAGALGSNEVPPLLSVAIWLSLSLCSVRKIDFYLLLWNNDEISPFFSLPSDVNFKVAFESEEMPWCIHSFVDPFWSDGGELPSSRPPSIWYYSVYLKKKKILCKYLIYHSQQHFPLTWHWQWRLKLQFTFLGWQRRSLMDKWIMAQCLHSPIRPNKVLELERRPVGCMGCAAV